MMLLKYFCLLLAFYVLVLLWFFSSGTHFVMKPYRSPKNRQSQGALVFWMLPSSSLGPLRAQPENHRLLAFWRKYIDTKVLRSYKYCLSWWLRWYRICLQYRRPRFDPWIRNGNPQQYSCLKNSTAEEPGRLQSMWRQKSRTELN